MALPTDLPTLNYSLMGKPFLMEAVYNDFVDSQTIDISHLGQPFVANDAAYESTKQLLGNITGTCTTSGFAHLVGRISSSITGSVTTSGAMTLRGLPTKPNNLDFHFLGQPFADQPGDTYIDITTIDYARNGQPFVSNAEATYNPIKTLNSSPLTCIVTTAATIRKIMRISASITGTLTTGGSIVQRSRAVKPLSLDFHWFGKPFADIPSDTYVDLLTMDYPRTGWPFVSNATATYQTIKTLNGAISGTCTTAGAIQKIMRMAASITGTCTTAGGLAQRRSPSYLEAMDFHLLGQPFVWKQSQDSSLLTLDNSLLGRNFATGWLQVIRIDVSHGIPVESRVNLSVNQDVSLSHLLQMYVDGTINIEYLLDPTYYDFSLDTNLRVEWAFVPSITPPILVWSFIGDDSIWVLSERGTEWNLSER